MSIKKMFSSALAIGTLLLAVGFAAPAQAQDAPKPEAAVAAAPAAEAPKADAPKAAAPAAAPAAAAAAAPAPVPNKGDTAWMLVCTAFVILMTLPGLGLFYGGLVRSKNMLSARLRDLIAHGILETVPAPDGSAHHEYVLTEKGRGLFYVLVALRQWGETYFSGPGEPYTFMVDNRTGRPIRRLEVHAEDGRLLFPGDTRLADFRQQQG